MPRHLTTFLILIAPGTLQAADKVTYDDHVQPILRSRCFGCHNLDKKSGGLDMTSYTNFMQGGSSGAVVEPGDAGGSYLVKLITHESTPNMPPNGGKIPQAEIDKIKAWVDGGLLETMSSKAKVSDKPKVDLSLAGAPTDRPATPPMPWRLSLDPVVHTKSTDAVTGIATNPWSPLVAVAGQHQILLYHSADGRLLGVLPFPEGRAQVLRFSRNGSLLLAGGGQGALEGKVVLWNVKTGERVAEIGDEYDEVLAADISPDQRLVALGGPNRIVRVFSVETGEVVYEIKKHTDWVTAIAFSPDGVLLVTGDRNGGVHVWEGRTGREYLTLNGHKGEIGAVSWRIDGNVLATSAMDGQIKLWEMENGGNVKSWGAHGGGVSDVEFTRDARIVSCGRDKTTKIWDQNGAQQRAFPAFGDIALRVSHCDESNHVVAGDWTGQVLMWKADDGALVAELSVNPPELEQRKQQAEQALAAATAEFTKLDAAAKAAEAEAAKQKVALDANNQAMAAATKAIADATNVANAAKTKIAQQTAAKDGATKGMAATQPVVTLLTEASAKLAEASGKAADDAELKKLAADAKVRLDAKSSAMAAMKTSLDAATAALAAANAELATATKTIADSQAKLAAAKKEVERLTPVIKTTGEQATAARAAANAAAAKQAEAQKRVAETAEAIAFAEQLRQLEAKQREREPLATAVNEAEAVVAAANAKVGQTASGLEVAKKSQAEVAAAMTQIVAGIAKATGERDAYLKTASTVEPVAALLGESVTKAKEAAAKLPQDEALKTAVAALENELNGKTKLIADSKQAAAAKTAELTKLAAEKTAAEQRVAAGTKAVAAAEAAVAAATKEQQEVTAKLQAARATLAQFDGGLQAIEDKVQAMRGIGAADATARADASK